VKPITVDSESALYFAGIDVDQYLKCRYGKPRPPSMSLVNCPFSQVHSVGNRNVPSIQGLYKEKGVLKASNAQMDKDLNDSSSIYFCWLEYPVPPGSSSSSKIK
jgi:hypothetical protein